MNRHFFEFLQRFNMTCQINGWENKPENTKAVVFVDGTTSWNLPIVVKEHLHFLGPEWNLYLFYNPQNVQYIEEHFSDNSWQISKFVTDKHINLDVYSDLLKEIAFWTTFKEQHVLISQKDSIMCQPMKDEFLRYDIIGAPCGNNGKIWNGGFTLRSPECMIRALTEYAEFIEDKIEDVFFSKSLRLMSKLGEAIIPNGYESTLFSTESYYYKLPIGFHGIDKYYTTDVLNKKIVNQIVI